MPAQKVCLRNWGIKFNTAIFKTCHREGIQSQSLTPVPSSAMARIHRKMP